LRPLKCNPINHFLVLCPTSGRLHCAVRKAAFMKKCVCDFVPERLLHALLDGFLFLILHPGYVCISQVTIFFWYPSWYPSKWFRSNTPSSVYFLTSMVYSVPRMFTFILSSPI